MESSKSIRDKSVARMRQNAKMGAWVGSGTLGGREVRILMIWNVRQLDPGRRGYALPRRGLRSSRTGHRMLHALQPARFARAKGRYGAAA
jgi:hypothetical protein